MTVGVNHMVLLSAVLFSVGVFGLLARRNGVAMLMSIELMLTAATVALVGFARFGYNGHRPLAGMVFALLVITVAVAEAGLGAALLLLAWRRHGTADADELASLGED